MFQEATAMVRGLHRFSCFALGAALLVPVLAGCSSVVGQWSLKEVEPTAAQRDVQYRTLTLQKNGTFYAEANEGEIKTVSGTYDYNAKTDTITFREHDREQNTYDAQLKDGGQELQLLSFWEGRKLKAIYEKEEG